MSFTKDFILNWEDGNYSKFLAMNSNDVIMMLHRDKDGAIALRLTSKVMRNKIELSNFTTQCYKIDGKNRLDLFLETDQLVSIFCEFLDYLSECLPRFTGDDASAFLKEEARKWTELMSKPRKWTKEKILGLWGELDFMQHILEAFKTGGLKSQSRLPGTHHELLSGWGGPAGKPQDFDFGELKCEIKCIGEHSDTVSISSIQQLDVNDGKLSLVVVKINHDDQGESVAEKVEAIATVFREHGLEKEFRFRLSLLEYDDEKTEQFSERFSCGEPYEWYDATAEDFPSIRASTHPAISSAAYTIKLNALNDFKTQSEF